MTSQFDYYQPLTQDEREVAEHEAAHAVMALAVTTDSELGDTLVYTAKSDSCILGEVRSLDQSLDPDCPYNLFPPFDATVPHKWRKAAGQAYGSLLVFYAGPAQSRRFFELDLSGPAIRQEPCGENDNKFATALCAHFWQPEHVESVLDLAATVAGAMTGLPAHQKAIHALADFLTENRRRKATGIQASVIVRPFIPAPTAAPFTDEVLQWIKQH